MVISGFMWLKLIKSGFMRLDVFFFWLKVVLCC